MTARVLSVLLAPVVVVDGLLTRAPSPYYRGRK